MKTIGLIGGMSWESSADYYRILNELVRERLGGHHSAQCILYSIDFADLERLQHQGDWEGAKRIMVDAAQRLERAGADFLIMCANTMHRLADAVQKEISIPILHVIDAVADAIKARGMKKAGLLGTRYTMEDGFYRDRLLDYHNIITVIPDRGGRDFVHRVIYEELCLGIIRESSRNEFVRIMNSLMEKGGEGVILGCTEIPMLIPERQIGIPVFDTTWIHAEAAVALSLKD